MKKFIIMIIVLPVFAVYSQDDLPSIILPKIDVQIEDLKQFGPETALDDSTLTDIEYDDLPRPDFTEEIKVDLEKTLPQKILLSEEQKPVDALILFGYGINNNLYADFSIFVKQYNPKVSIHYLRNAKETLWFDRTDMKTPYSLDDLRADIIYNYKNFYLGAEMEYFANSYGLQKESVFDDFTKRVLTVDLGPSFKFNYQNDLTVRILNSFLFTDCDGEINDKSLGRDDFDYLLETDIMYTQVVARSHFFTSHLGYDFNFLYSLINGNEQQLSSDYDEYFFNTIKAGISYSTTLADAFLLKGSVEFLGMFRDYTFLWYIIPFAKFGYSFQDYFNCYVEGGASLEEKPGSTWFKENNYVVFPAHSTPGYHWYAKSGVKGAFPGWISVNTDVEFAYNMDGNQWDLTSTSEKLYTLTKANYMELNLSAGINFNYREYLELKVEYTHHFLDKQKFEADDDIYAIINCTIPTIGLTMFVDFEGRFARTDVDNDPLGNVYLMNAGIDWNYQERIGVGAKFNNILYIQKHQLMPDYDEPGFEFIVYLKIGF